MRLNCVWHPSARRAVKALYDEQEAIPTTEKRLICIDCPRKPSANQLDLEAIAAVRRFDHVPAQQQGERALQVGEAREPRAVHHRALGLRGDETQHRQPRLVHLIALDVGEEETDAVERE